VPPELDQPRLARVQFQTELREPAAQLVQEPFRVFLILEPGDEVVREPHDDHVTVRVAQAVETHHEAFDGSGYPGGLKGENIPLYGRIVAVADAYVNMTSDRSFAPPKTDEQAMVELGKLS